MYISLFKKFLTSLHVYAILCGHTHLLSELVEHECADGSRVCGVCSSELPLTFNHINYCREGGRERKREGEKEEGKMKRGREIEEREREIKRGRESKNTVILCTALKNPPCNI